MEKMEESGKVIEYGLTGPDWEPDEKTKFYASTQIDGVYHNRFASTARQAVLNLMEILGD